MLSLASTDGALGLIQYTGPQFDSLPSAPLPEAQSNSLPPLVFEPPTHDTRASTPAFSLAQEGTTAPSAHALSSTHSPEAHQPSAAQQQSPAAQQPSISSLPSNTHELVSEAQTTPPDPLRSTEHPSSSSIPPLKSPQKSTGASLNSHSMTTRTKDRTLKQRQFSDFVALHSTANVEPTSFTQAVKSSNWRSAMAAEIDALASNRTWSLVPAPPNRHIIGSKWVYKIKRNSDGSIERYKARLVAKGYNQQQGIDFDETYSPVIRATTI